MSKNLQHFVNNFVLGMQLGDRIQDRRDLANYRRDSLEVARAKNTQSADQFKQKMANDTARTQGYLQDVQGRYIKNTTPKAAKAGAAGPSPAQEAYDLKYGAPPANTQPQAQPVVVMPEPEDTGTPQPPAGMPDDTSNDYARGGRIMGQAINTGMALGQRSANLALRQRPNPVTAGTNGPGSGFGAIATRAPTQLDGATPDPADMTSGTGGVYRRGGAVRHFAEGGPVADYPDDASKPQSKWDRDRVAFELGKKVGREETDTREQGYADAEQSGQPPAPRGPAPEPQPGGDRPPIGGARPGGATFGGQRFGGWTPEQGYPAPPEAAGPPVPAGPARGLRDTVFGHADRPGALDTGRSLRDTVFGHAQPATPNLPPDTDAPMPNMGMPNLPQDSDAPLPVFASGAARGAPPAVPGVARGVPPAGGGGGGGRGAINTSGGPWKRLNDQTRTAAYDPQKDLYDPDNVHATAPALAGAVSYADRVFHQGDIQGQGGGQGDAPNASLASRGKAALFGGTGAADQKIMLQIIQKVDPDNTMSMDQKMTAAVKSVHDFYMKNGDTENANKSTFEVAQFANKMASEHGKEALKLMQSGNTKGALDMLVEGYNFLPDGHTAAIENGQITIKDGSGNVAAQYAVDQRSLANIALGMASGQLGWDVIRMGAQTPAAGPAQAATPPPAGAALPAARQVAAQPAAAPAGPSQTPAAPATVAPAATIATSPPAVTPGAAPVPKPPAGPPVAPLSGGAPAAKPAGETTPVVPPPTNPPGVPSQGDDVRTGVDTKRIPVTMKSPDELEQEHYNKNPFGAPPGITREQAPDPDKLHRADVEAQIAKMEEAQNQRDKENMIEGRRAGKKPADIRYNITRERKELDEKKKALLGDLKSERDRQERRDTAEITAARPRDVPLGGEEQFAQTMAARTDALASEAQKKWREAGPEKAAADQASKDNAASVLRWAQTPKDKETLNRVATGIWRYNRGNSANNSLDDAVTLTAILRPKPDGSLPPGMNRQQGKNATQFKRMPDGPDRTVVLQLPTGRTIHMNRNTYGELVSLHQQNWKQYEEEAATAKKSNVIDGAAMQGIQTMIPKNWSTPPERGQVPY